MISNEMRPVPVEQTALFERIKELNCLYDISRLFSQRTLSLDTMLKEIVRTIPNAWQFPENTCARISHRGREYQSENYSAGNKSLAEKIKPSNRDSGFVEVCYLGDPDVSSMLFLEDEKKLLKAIAELLGSIIEKKEAETSLKRTSSELHKKATELESKNIALRELIAQIEFEKKALQDQIRLNIELTVLPLLNKMQNRGISREAWHNYLQVARQNLEDVSSSFTRKVIEDRVRLSPRELEICNLIKNGLANKEIAQLLHISPLTVERHRHNVRKKLRIDNEKVNLATFLREL